MQATDRTCLSFPISEEEFKVLDREYGKLCHHAGWDLNKKNSFNNITDDHDDFAQELKISLMQAGSYHKRQVYIQSCLNVAKKYVKNKFLKKMVKELEYLWENKTRHGANRQKFGEYQEKLLETLVKKVVPKEEQPDRNRELIFDETFEVYCKSIMWNKQKALGKKITREKSWRSGLVSINEYTHLV